MTTNWRRHAITAAKLALATALVAWLIATDRLELDAYARLLGDDGPLLVASLAAMQAAALLIVVLRWHGLAHVQGIAVRWRDVLVTGGQGLFAQLFVPGGLGSDGLRLLYVRHAYSTRLPQGVVSLLADRISGLLSLLLLGVIASAGFRAARVLDGTAATSVLDGMLLATSAALVATVVILWSIARMPRLELRVPAFVRRAAAELRQGLAAYASRPRALGVAIAISATAHLLTCAAAYLGLVALGVTAPPVIGVVAITCVLNCVRMIPLTPLGLGVTDLAAEHLYALIDIPIGAELQMLQRLVSMSLCAIAGLAFVFRFAPAPEAAGIPREEPAR